MTKKGTERASAFVVVSRKTLIVGMFATAVLSFAAGYFIGYDGPSSEKIVRPVEADNKKTVSAEKTVLDSSGNPAVVAPPSTPDPIPKEFVPASDAGGRTAQKPVEPMKITRDPAPVQKIESKGITKETPATVKKTDVAPVQDPQTPKEKITGKTRSPGAGSLADAKRPQGKKEQVSGIRKKTGKIQPRIAVNKKPSRKDKGKPKQKPAVKSRANKLYSVQVGSFLDPGKAVRLKEALDGKGFTAHIITGSGASGKSFSRVRIGAYRIKADAEELIPKLRAMGLECVIVPAPM
jgi:cell division protein FtsN